MDRRGFLCGTAAAVTATGAGRGADVDGLLRRCLDSGAAVGFPGLACAVLARDRTAVGGTGAIAGPGSPAPDGATVFQMGSVAKTFTALGLAVSGMPVDDPVGRHLPWPVPGWGQRCGQRWDGRPVTLVDLATHTSGLPRLPANLTTVPGFDPANPYATYTRADLAAATSATVPATEPGTHYDYSNYGYALLGQAVCPDYAALLRSLALPLGMPDTGQYPDPLARNRKAIGHGVDGRPVPDWEGDVFAGMGAAAYSTVDDLVRYLRAQLDPAATPFAAAIERTQQPHFTVDARLRIGLAWHRIPLPSGRTLVWHNGETGGHTSYVGFCPRSRTGVVLLANAVAAPDPRTGLTPLDALGTWLAAAVDAAAAR